jgi:hypothetical protein
MKTWTNHTVQHYANDLALPRAEQLTSRPSALCLVSLHELKALSAALACGALPPDFEAKLTRLAEGDLIHRFLAQNGRLFAALLLAAQDGSFKGASRADCERLLRVLAYVRKEDDAIPDYQIGGFTDDQQEMRMAVSQLQPLLSSFKAWRLRNQVPAMWFHN